MKPRSKRTQHTTDKLGHNVCETHGDAASMADTIFAAVFFLLVLAPLVCIPFVVEDVSAEKRELAPVPSLQTKGCPNLNVLQDAGAWFEDHFAFRGELVDLNATIKERLLNVSATENVVVGSNGWLYYAGTLNDYQGRGTMSDHALKNAAKNISLMQEWVTSLGKSFVFAIAPNKNTLYPQYMPYYEVAREGEGNLDRLMRLLAGAGINCIDLRTVFMSQGKTLYFARDTHWNAEGAMLAYRAIANGLPTTLVDYAEEEPVGSSHKGDLDQMLHPKTAVAEKDLHWAASDAWTITNDATGVEDNTVTTSSTAEGAAPAFLVMYRDSFGNNLLPYFAASYANATFSRLVPYDMGSVAIRDATDVVVERAERHIDLFATDPPYMPSPVRRLGESHGTKAEGDMVVAASAKVAVNGPYVVVDGVLDGERVGEDVPIYVELTFGDGKKHTVEAFHVSQPSMSISDTDDVGADPIESQTTLMGDWGYRAYFYTGHPDIATVERIRVMCGDASAPTLLADV